MTWQLKQQFTWYNVKIVLQLLQKSEALQLTNFSAVSNTTCIHFNVQQSKSNSHFTCFGQTAQLVLTARLFWQLVLWCGWQWALAALQCDWSLIHWWRLLTSSRQCRSLLHFWCWCPLCKTAYHICVSQRNTAHTRVLHQNIRNIT